MLLKIDFFAVKARQFTVLLYNGFKISGVVAAIIRCVRPCQFAVQGEVLAVSVVETKCERFAAVIEPGFIQKP